MRTHLVLEATERKENKKKNGLVSSNGFQWQQPQLPGKRLHQGKNDCTCILEKLAEIAFKEIIIKICKRITICFLLSGIECLGVEFETPSPPIKTELKALLHVSGRKICRPECIFLRNGGRRKRGCEPPLCRLQMCSFQIVMINIDAMLLPYGGTLANVYMFVTT
ncbi:hypothetical protein CEXT_19631 [Caerostris extrusa]|uniref:Uncharacterized protein n=1 Tax=Caerostris extrusa TaxID=172846 RepID=A0AAV4TQX8_CAEEX|nr:hypothetical protein CEXT_19631 [Caerostris extrusa]